MGQSTPIDDLTAASENARALEWAEIAGLVTICSDGSWMLTDFGKAQVLKLEDTAMARQQCGLAATMDEHRFW